MEAPNITHKSQTCPAVDRHLQEKVKDATQQEARQPSPHSLEQQDPFLCCTAHRQQCEHSGYNTPAAMGEIIPAALPATPQEPGLLTCVGKIEGHADGGVVLGGDGGVRGVEEHPIRPQQCLHLLL